MTADTSWYGQQTLVHPDYSHQPYAPYETYGDPYAGHYQQQYGYPQEHGYAQPYGYVGQYAGSYAAPSAHPAPSAGYGWPDYYPGQHEPTLVTEYAGYPGHVDHSVHQGYNAQHGYALYPEQPDYSSYDTVTDVPFAAVVGHPWTDPETALYPESDDLDPPLPSEELSDDAVEVAPGRKPVADRHALEAEDDYVAARGSRRRGARRRSAVLTIAVPSVAVLGVAGAAAATIGPLRAHHHDTTASGSTTQAAAQAKAQALAASEARDAAERAARDKARTALQLREAAARKAAAEAPRYVLPIAYHTGLSALFGQAGTHWMQLHTGIDFPVPVGTPVHAVTGGTVTTEWNPFYGYMVKLTAPDGTVTWYCHLSSYRVRSGQVKVGDIIAYSGDTGNSTGPHLHFEVHPGGGPAVDPLPWLLDRGLDPR